MAFGSGSDSTRTQLGRRSDSDPTAIGQGSDRNGWASRSEVGDRPILPFEQLRLRRIPCRARLSLDADQPLVSESVQDGAEADGAGSQLTADLLGT